MTRAGWIGLLSGCGVSALGFALVVLLPFYPTVDLLLLIAALVGGPLASVGVHGSFTRFGMGLTGDWDPQRAAAELQGGRGIGR